MDFDPDDATQYLEGVDYPASKEDLTSAAEGNEPPCSQRLFQNVVAVAPRVIRDVRDDFVPELLVERLCLEAERSQKDSVASLHSGFVFCGPE